MEKKKKKKKGFTLIELLAVIIILGILMIIAIPSVTKYISDSRKSAYIDTAKEIVSGARNVVNEGKLEMYDTNTTYYIPYSCISTENAKKTPYGEFVKAYTAVLYDGHGYDYYFFSVDDAGQGIRNLKKVDDLEVEDIESDLKVEDINTRQVIGNKTAIKVYNDTCTSLNENITIERPTFRVLYGFDIFSSPNYTLIDINKNENILTTTSNNAIIRLNDLGRYTNIEKIIITLNEGISGAVPIKVKSNGNVVGQTTTSNGTKKIEIDITKSTYDSLDIVIEKSGVVLDVDKIEVLTEDSGIWSNSNVTLYIDSDNDLSNTQVSYDNGKTWQDDFSNEINETESGNVLVKTEEQVLSIPINVVIKVDKVTPSVSLVARDTSGREITTGTWTKYGINFTLTQTTTNTSGTHIYYCKDNNGTCTPNIEVNSGTLITEFNNLVGTYFVRYTIKSNAGLQDGTGDFYAKVDKTRPTCSFDTLPDVYVNKESVINLNCTDLESGINIQDLTTNDFTLSNNNMTITSITKETITNGVKYKITVRGVNDGDTNLALKENVFEDNVTNKNTGVSTNVHINGVFKVTLNNQSATTAGTTEIYELYTVGWYSNANVTTSISSITRPSKNGYMFEGYYTSTNGEGTQVIDSSGNIISGKESTFNNDGTLHAKWVECGNGSYCANNTKTSCPAGTVGNGTTNASTQGAACVTCPAGAYCTGGTNQTTCPAGTYRTSTGGTASSSCSACGNGAWCTGGTHRETCPAGTYASGTTNASTQAQACLDGCASGNTYDSPSCGGWSGCSASCNGSTGTQSRTCTHKYYSNKISGYLCSTGSSYTQSTSCSGSSKCWHLKKEYNDGHECGVACPNKCSDYSDWHCQQNSSYYEAYPYHGPYCWCYY